MNIFTPLHRSHYRKNLSLAYPVIFGQMGHMIAYTADSIMVGQLGSAELAAVSLAGTVWVVPYLFALGFASGLTPLAGVANGKGDPAMLQKLFGHSLLANLLFAVLVTAIVYMAHPLLGMLGQAPRVVELAVPYYKILTLSIIPSIFFLNFKQFAEGLELTKPTMVMNVVFNLLNVLFNYWFIYGNMGFPAMGVEGAGWGTFLSRLLMLFAAFGYMLWKPWLRAYLVGLKDMVLDAKVFVKLLRMGLPIGAQIVIEVGVFSVGAIWVGQFGESSLAAHQIVINITSLTYLMSLGFASAATIRVSNYLGKGDFPSLRMAGQTSFVMVIFFMAFTGLLIYFLRDAIPGLFISGDPEVQKLAASILIVAALYQIFDGLQAVGMHVLRGLHDVRVPTYIASFSYWVVGMGVSWLLAFPLGMGPLGIWIGFLAGLACAAVLFVLRYRKIVARMADARVAEIDLSLKAIESAA